MRRACISMNYLPSRKETKAMTYDESCLEVDKMFEYYEANSLDDEYIRESINEMRAAPVCAGVSRGTLKIALQGIIQEQFSETELEHIPRRTRHAILRVVGQ